ncbi:MAG: hypothetical protein OEM25_06175 [Gammaproteobacteria bacterium]|nr:hypothetical protein [Gammaproteobacteria bacterium]
MQRAASRTGFLPTKSAVDIETVTAILRNRFHMPKLYGSAEATGIEALHAFARQLRGYSMRTA